MVEVFIRAEAVADLAGIHTVGTVQFGKDTTDRYLSRLETAIGRIGSFPLSGPIYPGIRPPVRYVAFRRHHIFYDTDGNSVWIVRVLHHAQDAAWQL